MREASRHAATPIQTKVDQVADQSNKQGTDIEAAKKDLERHETGINAAKERAMSAEKAAGDAMNKATEAGSTATEARNMAQKNGQDLNSLRDNVQNTLGNLDDYKLAAETVIPFGFNKDNLSKDAKDQLDQFVKEHGTAKRYFITVEGYTDKTGTKAYNDALSQRRAERVMRYLIAQENIPLFRV